jgi:hypothetical protein
MLVSSDIIEFLEGELIIFKSELTIEQIDGFSCIMKLHGNHADMEIVSLKSLIVDKLNEFKTEEDDE